ncbi:DUF108 domain-containing protein [Paenarthrobacter sp. CC6]|uniref:aspartate dehydrogenase domain-containing protein n=1 Tax=Paenarthrobacter TaxID=1742992 RepID=UPI00057CC356|nr:aspartate dehydrogenase domain-containing protein [Paenarthrobacter nicotinovorans]KIA71365.1 L-aspartate dehydrogenase NadX [Arthrobacter sp. MWB30]KQR06877.1 aspartate dehydrogenase [Arthrobacter sp. Leaf145]GAT87543.1 hypothetical protein CVCC1112_2202 [Paenarthrobacter nicotinovorans]
MTSHRIGIIGYGAIGARVAEDISLGKVVGAELAGIISRTDNGTGRPAVERPFPSLTLEAALECCELIVECAGQSAVAEYAEKILGAGVDFLITSIGALADQGLAARLNACGPGRLFMTSGAVGGLDLLEAGAREAAYDSVVVSTTKLPETLVQPWMEQEQADGIRATTEPLEVFLGSAQEAARLFPRSLNVAAAVAEAVGDWDGVQVRLTADPKASLTSHVIEASGPSGEYRFEIRNNPSPQNPRTSGIVPFAVLRSLEAAIGERGGLV